MSVWQSPMRGPIAMLACLTAAGPAPAAPRPLLVPQRDVTVQYTVQPQGDAALAVSVAILAGGSRLRIQSESLPMIILVDRPAGEASMLSPMLRAYARVAIRRYDPEETMLKGAQFERGGRERVAGLPCTDWMARSKDGKASGCLTDDGILLRGAATGRNGRSVSVTASRVSYGGLRSGDFEVPADYQALSGGLPFSLPGLAQ